MDDTTDPLADEALPRARLALLLEQFSRLDDERESWRVMYPLSEVLLLLTCATIASCDDFGFLATFGDQVPAVWPQSPCRLTSWFRFTAASPKVAKSHFMWISPQASPHFCAWEVCLLDPGGLNISATEATM